MMHPFMGYGWIFPLLILVLFFVVVWWMLRNSGSFGYRTGTSESALDILKKRLASGEIDEKQFKKLRKEIEKG